MKIRILTIALFSCVVLKACKQRPGSPGLTIQQTGEIYQTKLFEQPHNDSFYLEVNKFSTFKFPKAVDTTFANSISENPTGKNPRTIECWLDVPLGEQWTFRFGEQAKVWLNTASHASVYYIESKPANRLLLNDSEAYIETADSIAIILNDSAKLICPKGTYIYVRNFVKEPFIEIFAVKGSYKVMINDAVKYHAGFDSTIKLIYDRTFEGTTILKSNFRQTIDWKDAGTFHFKKANLQFVLNSLEKWYRAKFCFNETLPDYPVTISFPYSLPLNKALEAIEQETQVKFYPTGDSIFVHRLIPQNIK